MQVIEIKQKVIRTKTDYTESYRFRLWVALIDDMDLLGMGHRAYHSHIFESHRAWEAEGIKFLNAKDQNLNLDALSKDDIYGFLGKKDQAPTGPKRKIETAKFAVLDAFFQAKYPKLTAAFDVDTPVVELISVLRTFLAPEMAPRGTPQERFELHRSIDGIFFPRPRFSVADLRTAKKKGEPFARTIPTFIVNARMNHCVVHKVEFPLRVSYLRTDSSERDTLETIRPWIERHAPEETKIYSGIGLLNSSEHQLGDPSLACILRDRVLYRPCLTTLQIQRFYEDEKDDPYWVTDGAIESSGDDWWRYFIFCKDPNNYAKMSEEVSYSADFINDVFKFKSKLGSEV